jgi:hypothetical protein
MPRLPSLLSQQIQKLESEVRGRLFERTRRRAILTPAGALFLPHVPSILETAEQGRQEIRGMSGQVRGQVLLAALPTIAPYFLPEIIRLFQEKYRADYNMVNHGVSPLSSYERPRYRGRQDRAPMSHNSQDSIRAEFEVIDLLLPPALHSRLVECITSAWSFATNPTWTAWGSGFPFLSQKKGVVVLTNISTHRRRNGTEFTRGAAIIDRLAEVLFVLAMRTRMDSSYSSANPSDKRLILGSHLNIQQFNDLF